MKARFQNDKVKIFQIEQFNLEVTKFTKFMISAFEEASLFGVRIIVDEKTTMKLIPKLDLVIDINPQMT